VLRKKAEGRQKEGRRKKAADRHGLKKVKKGKEGTKAKGR